MSIRFLAQPRREILLLVFYLRRMVILPQAAKTNRAAGRGSSWLSPKPCVHLDCPVRQGFIRGQYESVELVREVPIEKPLRRVRSSIDISRPDRKPLVDGSNSMNKEAPLRSAEKAGSDGEGFPGRTVSFGELFCTAERRHRHRRYEMSLKWP